MPWVPEVFSAPALAKVLDSRGPELASVPYFDGLMAGETDALVKSFAGVPEVHVPLRGRVKGARAFDAYIAETSSWLRKHNVSVEDVEHVITDEHGFEEVVLHLDGHGGRVDLPVAVVADRRHDGRIDELRIYFSNAPLGRHAHRPPVLQRDPDLRLSDVVGEYHRALAAGDVDAIVAAFEPDGLAREPAGTRHVNGDDDGLRRFYERLFSNGGGVALEACAVIDDERACALEYNVARWGQTELAPEAGFAVYVRGPGRRLAAARTYDDADFRLHPQT
ncbi:MAG TPA: nuclear transport factor 2 family protein [Solirubrobacteraceae bacterium]|jgi:hypothetical protein|nr:nuclear transport factor 2 family protein [Solirubrobacteraceae bacterium]